MQLQKHVRQLKKTMYLDKDTPPPRWVTLIASGYLGMMLFLAAHLVKLI
jgi:hypothetical protein